MRSADLEAQVARRQRLRKFEEEIVDVVTLLGADFEQIAEAAGGDKTELGALALDARRW